MRKGNINFIVLFIISFLIFIIMPIKSQAVEYRLQQDDQLGISVWGHLDLVAEVGVSPDGIISLPLIADIRAEGLTIKELNEKLINEYSKYIKNPQVIINLKSYRKSQVMIMGEVREPDKYQLEENFSLLEALSLAGGPTEIAALDQVRLTRGGELKIFNLEEYLAGDPVEEDYFLEDGDLIYIPSRIIEVTIMGQVQNPGRFKLEKGMVLTDLIAFAGGITEQASSELEYISGNNIENIEITSLLNGSRDVPKLNDSDLVYIHGENYEVSILGEVNRPGIYPWHQEMRLDDILAAAGNQTKRGDIEKVKIFHKDGNSQEINLEKYFADSNAGENPLLKPGDMVKIGEIESINWQEVFIYITGAKLIKDFLEISW